jgi:hypothetical protein
MDPKSMGDSLGDKFIFLIPYQQLRKYDCAPVQVNPELVSLVRTRPCLLNPAAKLRLRNEAIVSTDCSLAV